MKLTRLTLLLLLALAACSGGNDDDDDDITTAPNDDDDVTTNDDDDDDVTSNDDDDVTDDDDDTTPEIIERSFVVTDSITFYWNEDANDPVTPAPSAAALAGEVPSWDEAADAMRLTPVLEGLPSGTAFPLGARWEIAIDEATRGALEELLPEAYASISDAGGTEYAYDIYDDAQFVIPVEHFSSFAVLLGAGSLGGGIGGGNSALIAFLSAIIGGGGPLAGILTDLFLGVTCGNGALDDFEACDGDVPCESACYAGAMACSDDCKVLDSACDFGGQACGNSALEGCEVCDGDSQECFNGCYFGANACTDDCAGFDSTCDTGEQMCGNGLIEGCEVCDDGAANGTPGMCNTSCSFPNKIRCGNLVKEGFEICDGGTADCNDGCYDGVKYCYNDCNGYGGCEVASQRCGNGKVEGCEVCDDGPLGACLDDCTGEATEFCGDGYVTGAEECDSLGVDTAACDSDCTKPACGDAYANTVVGETCDDGPGGTCFDDCSAQNVCGDSIVFAGEACDSGGVDTSACDSDCTAVACGDAHPNSAAGEVCDDGAGGTCHDDCSAVNACGDGIAFAGEVCDDGAGGTCHDDCSAVNVCGDGIVFAGEVCDDGAGGTCHDDCSAVNVCGDSIVFAGEVCDDGPGGTCHDDCSAVNVCGDGILFGGGEICDDGAGGTCHDDCSAVNVCGDSIAFAGEVCDDGAGGTCHDDCSAVNVCGDSIAFAGEVCDDGAPQGEGLCLNDCTGTQTCGDGTANGTEACDDGDTTDCGLCNSNCTANSPVDFCGDGIVCGAETCDDGNNTCAGPCNAACSGPSVVVCGDGQVCGSEVCDDGNNTECGTCNATCTGASPADTCGDGIVCGGEVCDDGDTLCTGTCSATCTGPATATCGNGIQEGCEICDTFPHNPTVLSTTSTGEAASFGDGVLVGSNYFVSARFSIMCYNVSNPAAPVSGATGVSGQANAFYGLEYANGYLFASSGSLIYVYSVSGCALTFVRSTSVGNYPNDLEVIGNTLYISMGGSGFATMNVSTPGISTPVLDTYNTPDSALDVDIDSGRAYIADGTSVQILDVSNPSNITFLSSYPATFYAYGVDGQGNRLYVGDNAQMIVLDVTSPATPTLVANVSTGLTGRLVVVGRLAYIDASFSTNVYDIFNPLAPVLVGSVSSSGSSPSYMDVSNNRVYVTESGGVFRILSFSQSGTCGSDCRGIETCGNFIREGSEWCDDGPGGSCPDDCNP